MNSLLGQVCRELFRRRRRRRRRLCLRPSWLPFAFSLLRGDGTRAPGETEPVTRPGSKRSGENRCFRRRGIEFSRGNGKGFVQNQNGALETVWILGFSGGESYLGTP